MKSYQQLTQLQRYQIQGCEEASLSQVQIALQIGCHKSTISRELKRCKVGRYNDDLARKSDIKTRRSSVKSTRFTSLLWQRVIGQLARLVAVCDCGPNRIGERQTQRQSLTDLPAGFS